MKLSPILATLAVALILAASLADTTAASRRDDVIAGGPVPVANLDDISVRHALDFAITQINKHISALDASTPYRTLSKVTRATHQVVAGIRYSFELATAASTTCKAADWETLAAADCSNADATDLASYAVDILWVPWQAPAFSLLRVAAVENPPPVPGAPVPVDPAANADDEMLQGVVDFVLKTVNSRTNTIYLSVLDRVVSVTKQVVSGVKFDLRVSVGVSEQCMKNAPVDANTVCGIKDGSLTEVRAVVVFAPWKTPAYTLVSFEQATAAPTNDNSNNSTPTPPKPVGGVNEISNIDADSGALLAVQFALQHADRASNRIERLVMVRVLKATYQVVAGKLYKFEIRVAPSANCLKNKAAAENEPCVADTARAFTLKVTVAQKLWSTSGDYFTVTALEEVQEPLACSAIYSGFSIKDGICVSQRTVACSNPYPYNSIDACNTALSEQNAKKSYGIFGSSSVLRVALIATAGAAVLVVVGAFVHYIVTSSKKPKSEKAPQNPAKFTKLQEVASWEEK